MRRKAKLILTSAVIAALTVAGVSIATGGGGSSNTRDLPSTEPATPATLTVDRDGKRGERGRRFHRDIGDADVRAVLKDIRDAVADQAPAIAGPMIDKAENDGKITAAQADKLRQAAQELADGKRPDIRGLGRDEDVQEVIQDAFAAARDKAPGIAEPIIAKAVADDKITEAQADRVRQLVRRGPRVGKPHGPGLGRGPHPAFADEDVRAVLEGIREAVGKQATDIVTPVIDKAENDGKITAAQADRLRDALGDLAGGKPRGLPGNLDLRDEDVRDVVKDAFDALAAKTPGIANPIIDEAVADGKITERQADQLKTMQRRFKMGMRPHGPGHRPPDFDRPATPSPAPPPNIN